MIGSNWAAYNQGLNHTGRLGPMMSMTDQDLYNLKYIKMQKRNFAKETMQRKVTLL